MQFSKYLVSLTIFHYITLTEINHFLSEHTKLFVPRTFFEEMTYQFV